VAEAEGRLYGRDTSGRFVSGHPGPALKHGCHSRHVERGLLLPPGATLPAERERAVLADLGDLSTLQAGLVRRYVHAELIAEWLEGNLIAQGVLTTKGRTRAAVDVYLRVVDRVTKLAGELGLERRAKRIPSIEEALGGGRA
jgi:hypothetical protein